MLLGLALLVSATSAQQRPLALRADTLASAARPLDAWQLLMDELAVDVREADWSDRRVVAETEVAVLVLDQMVRRLDMWPETTAILGGWLPFAPDVPPRLRFLLERLRAEGLRNIGRFDDARGVYDDQGAVARFLVIGPFDNERGVGFDVAYPPEVDVGAIPPGNPWDPAWERMESMPGKVRDVAWTPNPGRHHPLGRVLIEQILRPDSQSVAYLGTMLEAHEERDLVLRFGSSGPVKVFLNGVELASRDVERPHSADQDRVVLPLQAGPNQLLIKVAVETGPWTFESRLTELDGRPVVDVPTSILEFSPVVVPPRETDAVPAAEGLDILTELLADPQVDGDTARLTALYHLLVHPDDVVERSARAAAELAVELSPDDAEAWYVLARANAPEGATRHEMEVNRRLAALKRTLQLDPEHVGALLALADFSMRTNPLPDRADEMTERAVDAAPDAWSTLWARAAYLDWRGRETEADLLRERAEATQEAGHHRSGLLARARRLHGAGETEAELALLELALERRMLDGRILDRLIRRLVDVGREHEAFELTDRVMWAAPFSVDRLLVSARLLERGEHPGRARNLVTHALAICPEDTVALMDLVRFDERSGDTEAALAGLREVLRLDPGNDNARRRLDIMTSATGDGLEPFDEPYRRDAVDLVNVPMEEGRQEGLEVLDRTVVYRVQPDGTEHLYDHTVYRVLSSRGIKQLDSIWIPAPGGAAVQLYNVRVIHPDGTFTRAATSFRRRRGGRGFDLPPLAVGDLVDVEYRLDQSNPGVFGEYFGIRHNFYPDRVDGMAPTRRSELVVISPEEVPLYVSERNAEGLERSIETDADGLTVRRWVATDLPRPKLQSAMPRAPEFLPTVDVTTYEDWEAFAHWWWSFIEKEFVTTPAMRAKVEELTAGLETEDEKIAAIARFVAQEVRYNAWPFGTHGYEPFSASTIFDRRFGDCKDKSILMRQLLAEVGVDAIPVLIKAEYFRSDEPLDAAMVGHFNHCITYVTPTSGRGGFYLDTTADLNPIGYLRADDQGARVLHVSDGGGSIEEIPYVPPEENARRRAYTVELQPDGSGVVEMHDESNGMFAVQLRQRYAGEQGDLEARLGRELREAFGNVVIESVTTSDLEDIARPAWLSTEFRVAGLGAAQGAGRGLRLFFDELPILGTVTERPNERDYDVVLDRPFSDVSTTRWVLPDGAEVVQIPRDLKIEVSGYVTYSQRVQQEANVLKVTREFTLHDRRIPLDDYAGFRDALREIRQAEARTFVVAMPESDS